MDWPCRAECEGNFVLSSSQTAQSRPTCNAVMRLTVGSRFGNLHSRQPHAISKTQKPAHLIGIINAEGLQLEGEECTVGEIRPQQPRREPPPPFQLQPRLQQQRRWSNQAVKR